MVKVFPIIRIICIAFLLTIGSKTAAVMAESNDTVIIEKMYRDMYSAMIEKDTVALGRLLDEDFVLVHMTGMRQRKRDYLQAIANGTLNYYSCTDSRTDVSVHGDCAQMIGCSQVEAAVFGGGRHTWSLRLNISLRKRSGHWLISEIKAGIY